MNKIIKSIILIPFIIMIFSCSEASSIKEEGIYAVFNTNMGEFITKLYYEQTPVTVGNFIALSEGSQEYLDPKTKEKVKKPFYDGLIFHLVAKDKVIQGGCPLGTGEGEPGYTFADEISDDFKFDTGGMLAMFSFGPDLNGSQFFITLAPFQTLNNKYTIFGKVYKGQKTLDKIGSVKVDSKMKPYKDVYIKNIKILRIGEKAKSFNALAAFSKKDEALKKSQENRAKRSKDFLKTLGVDENQIITTRSGLKYIIKKAGYGKIPVKGDTIIAHYSGYLEDGTMFDSSYEKKSPFETVIGVGQVIKGWDEAFLTMREGEKRVLIIPASLGYGEYGSALSNKTLIFDVELLNVRK